MSIVIFVSIALGVLLIVKMLIYRGGKEYKKQEEELAAVNKLDIREAEAAATIYLRDARVFTCVPGSLEAFPESKNLPQGVVLLLSRFEALETNSGTHVVVGREFIKKSALHPGYTIIGRGMEGSDVEFSLGVADGGEEIYELHEGEAPDSRFGTYSSIYHWIVAIGMGAS